MRETESNPVQLIRGAEALGKALGVPARTVYHLRNTGGAPIWHQPGLGLVARVSELDAWLEAGRAADDQRAASAERPVIRRRGRR
jgi:hypothetical protein